MLKRLEAKEAREARQRKNQTIIGVFIVVIMVSSIAGYALWGSPETEKGQQNYNDYAFVKTENGWQTQLNIEGKNIILNSLYLPQELENLTAKGKPLLGDFKGKEVYIMAESPKERQAASQLASALDSFALRLQLACSEQEADSEFCQDLPIKNCDNANMQTSIIVINEQEEKAENQTETTKASVNYKNNCLVIEARNDELAKAAEKAIFMIFGIMEK